MVLNLDNNKLAKEQGESDSPRFNERGGGQVTLSRLNFLKIGILGSFALLSWRMLDLQKPFKEQAALDPETPQPVSENEFITTKAPRGIIYDRNHKRLVSNEATYSVTITSNYLPSTREVKDKTQQAAIREQRQAVYDNLARFLGMHYYIGVVPEQVNNMSSKGVFRNPERNTILNELEILTGISSRDWDKRLGDMSREGRDKQILFVNEESPIPPDQFDRYKYLRDKFDTDVYFISEAERKMLEAAFFTPPYQPVEVWPNISRQDAMLLGERRLDFPGVDIKISYNRKYENPRLYSHILGYTGRFQNNEDLERSNKIAAAENASQQDPDDPSNKVGVYEIDDRIGVNGVEATMEAELRGRKGATEVQVNATGQILSTIRVGKPAQPGNNVHLTIDGALQEFVANSLEKWILESYRSYKTKERKPPTYPEGAAVVMDVNTGEVLALVSFPNFDNNIYNRPRKTWTDPEVKDMLDEQKAVELSRAVRARYAPGSCFKLITAAAVLMEKKFSRYTTVDCKRYINVPTTPNPTPSQPFRCWGTHGPMDAVGAIENSCDIYFFNAGVSDETSTQSGRNRYYHKGDLVNSIPFRGMGISAMNGYMALFNLGKRTGIELPGEYQGTLPGPHIKNWSIGDTMTTSIGQGDLEMTPLQVTMMTTAIANGGKLYQPKLVREITDPDNKPVTPFESKLIRDITKDAVKWKVPDPNDSNKQIERDFTISQGVLQIVRDGMLAVTGQRGTANRTMYNQMGDLKVAGKTGTAEYGEVIGKDDDGNEARATRAWFTAYAPFDKPKYAVTVLIPSGDIGNEGSTFAVPAAKEIFEYLFPELAKKPDPNKPPTTPTPARP